MPVDLGGQLSGVITDGKNVLVPVIHAVISAVFNSGEYPVSWSQAAVSAVFKKGDTDIWDNYRGIAVGNVVGKLYSMIIDARLSQWSEKQGLRAEGQAGFWKGYRTTDQLFVLRHVLAKYRSWSSKVYCCFVDFRNFL